MRNFLITTIFIVVSNFIFGQTFATANYYEFGFVDTLTQDVVWSDKVKMDPTLISMGSRNLRIHTEKFQQFFFNSQRYDLYEVKGYYYKSYSADGEECVIYVYSEDDGSKYLEIEHKSYVIKYSIVDLEQ
jgi:hypothetical protein